MVELEIQALSLSREGLLIDVGRCVTGSGFSLQRQRLQQDRNGVLLTMVVRGPARRRRALESALDAHARVVSFELFTHDGDDLRPHFAAARPLSGYVPPPAPTGPEHADDSASPGTPSPSATPVLPSPASPAAAAVPDAPSLAPLADLQQEFARELARMAPPAAAPAGTPAAPVADPTPFVDITALAPDSEAVNAALAAVQADHGDILGPVQALDRAVEPGAREPSLEQAGHRIATWLRERERMPDALPGLTDAIDRIALPALGTLVNVSRIGDQVHIHQSPLCSVPGHSGCSFYSGFLQGLLAPVIASGSPTVFPVCCRSFGADACVLALSDP